MQSFRRLHVWERAHQFALDVRKATRSFPKTGYGELKAQLIRAAESISTNIVEGAGAATRKEFARYLDIAIKSTLEVESQLQLALDLLHPRSEFVYFISEGLLTREFCGEHRSKHPDFACGHGMQGS